MTIAKCIKFPPQFLILDRRAICEFPAVFSPFVDPFGDPVPNISTVGTHIDLRRLRQRTQSLDRSLKLHLIVGRMFFSAAPRDFFGKFAVLVSLQEESPATGARISGARPVCIGGNLQHFRVDLQHVDGNWVGLVS